MYPLSVGNVGVAAQRVGRAGTGGYGKGRQTGTAKAGPGCVGQVGKLLAIFVQGQCEKNAKT